MGSGARLQLLGVSPERPEADRITEGAAEAPGMVTHDPYVVKGIILRRA